MSTPRAVLTETEIGDWAEELEGQGIETILERVCLRFGDRLCMTSNFGAEGVVVLDHLRRIAPGIPVIYLDTGFQFPETDRIKEEIRTRLGVNVVEFKSELSVVEQDRVYGERLFERDSNRCCHLRKVEPLARALSGYDAWIAALRRDQSPTRALIRVVEWNARHNMVKINPLARWTRKEVWGYIERHGLPYNRLYEKGYASIGCEPCTRRVDGEAHERSGRWDGLVRLECGIHL